ncbi:unnamed protein product [Ceratitis capitata]|nr:unnamed protein product [Ceratitis capitata]
MPFRVGSRQRANMICPKNGEVVNHLVKAGGIPLLVSVTSEYCYGMETQPATQYCCLNPHNDRRTPGGSSGGEGALNGAGATLFGVGSDIAGSIRLPSLFNGVFGHKPTGGVTSIVGHFPNCREPDGREFLQMGPITRFGCDLSLLMHVMAGKNAVKLNLKSRIATKDIMVYYSFGFEQLNGFLHKTPVCAMEMAIKTAVKCLANRGCYTERASMSLFKNSLEISISGIVLLQSFPYIINSNSSNKIFEHLVEFHKALLGRSEYTKEGIYFDLLRRVNILIKAERTNKYRAEAEVLKANLAKMLGDNGVLLLPTFPVPALHHNTSLLALWNIDYTLIFNIIGFPATHIPMGKDKDGLPVGFQVVAAPYNDRLCFQIARELESTLGGWVVPTPHDLNVD